MIKIENVETYGWEAAIRGMRNPMNSWEKSDSDERVLAYAREPVTKCDSCPTCCIGPNDHKLMMNLRNTGTDHRKFMRMIMVSLDITAPLYWWKEFDTYKVGTVANSCSTMHKIAEKEFTLEDFSCEHLTDDSWERMWITSAEVDEGDSFGKVFATSLDILNFTIEALNECRSNYLETLDKKYWWQMIQLLPSSYNQRRTVLLNYEVLVNIYKSRKNHKLDEWCRHDTPIEHIERNKDFASGVWGFCDWIETLPYSELITGEPVEEKEN